MKARRETFEKTAMNSSDQLKTGGYYAPTAYRSDSVPDQPPRAKDYHRGWLGKVTMMQLPWGNTQDAAPLSTFRANTPEMLRKFEKEGCITEELGFKDARLDHECQRHAPAALRSLVLHYMAQIGRFAFFAFAFILPFVYLTVGFALLETLTWLEMTLEIFPLFFWFLFIPSAIWKAGEWAFKFFPRWAFKEGRGPWWELNRRTGIVTVFEYDKKGHYGKTGEPERIEIPFYEFDAFVSSAPDRQGLPMHFFHFLHRYSKQVANLGVDVNPERDGKPLFAFWDYIQNYMDTSRPLPDTPSLEEYRHLDPVTAEHDKRTGRNPRYWRDMDDETWKEKELEMLRKVNQIDTLRRPNMMAEHVEYKV